MNLSKQGAAFIRAHEGFVGRHYLDPIGVPTIGIGFTWRSRSFRDWWAKNKGTAFNASARITRAEADEALIYLCNHEYGKAVDEFLGPVDQHIFDGATSPVYNLGPGSLQWKWAAALKAGDVANAAARLRKTGVTASGRRLAGLVARRKEEAELIAHGDYTIGGTIGTLDPFDDGMLVRGERGRPVRDLQKALAALGHYDGAIDGIFGHGTKAAVIAFQRSMRGLTVDGYAGPKTLAALKRAEPPDPPKSKPWFKRMLGCK